MSIQKLGYDVDDVLDYFDIKTVRHCQVLDDWTTVEGSFTEPENQLITYLADIIDLEVRSWNEEELKMNCISHIMLLAQIRQVGKIGVFYERTISATVKNMPLSVKGDCIVATPKGVAKPKEPYFFLQEYKKSKGEKDDPEGQMLTAMIIAQEINQDAKPLYGAWLEGKNWNFHVLNGSEYCTGRSFDASKIEDLKTIVLVLRKLKQLILNR